jgi:bacterial/archaeal transporter family protein
MKPWLFYSLLTVICWGLWGVFSGLASGYTRPRQTLIFQAVGVVAVVLVVFSMEHFQIQRTAAGFWWSVAGGAVNFLGFLFFFAAIEKGKATSTPTAATGNVSTIIALSSLYPVVTILLSILLLHDKITPRQGLGIVLALTAGWLLA